MCCASRSSPTKAAAPITGDRESTAEMVDSSSQDATTRRIESTQLTRRLEHVDYMFSARGSFSAAAE
jgi:hypothetical protein